MGTANSHKGTFFCIDAHTAGNPVRLVAGGGPTLRSSGMSAKRREFLAHHDWIRKGLMFEPRGHDMMSGSIPYPAEDAANDVGILFIETSGCLPMCGHGTIGTVTILIEKGLVTPKVPGTLLLEVPAGLVRAEYNQENGKVRSVKIYNVPAYLAAENLQIEIAEFGTLHCDVAYGGNFYAIVDPQESFPGLEALSAADILRYSPLVREEINRTTEIVHPTDPTIRGVSHVMWTGSPLAKTSSARNAVFYGDHAIDRSPCGTGTSARLAQWYAKGKLRVKEPFIHESIIGSTFVAKVEEETELAGRSAILPSIEGWAKITGTNVITIDEEDDPFALGFQVL